MNFIDFGIGARLRRERVVRGRSVAEQAAAIGVAAERLTAFENGTDRVPAAVLQRCCATLNLRPADIFSGVSPGPSPGAQNCRTPP